MNAFPHGNVHEDGRDLQQAVRSGQSFWDFGKTLTRLAGMNSSAGFDDAKQAATRQRRIERTCDELSAGKKRPCCWAGCIHRTDKAPSPWQQAVLTDKKEPKR